mmetsp:Transcript_29766/g.83160  ORF Transcript_29766/g.83160 Transcript_29766/m.83160 type:complete len:104 (+) Transcript_29766:251-562(+)
MYFGRVVLVYRRLNNVKRASAEIFGHAIEPTGKHSGWKTLRHASPRHTRVRESMRTHEIEDRMRRVLPGYLHEKEKVSKYRLERLRERNKSPKKKGEGKRKKK